MSEDQLASACLLFDDKSLSSGFGNTAAEPGHWDEMVAGHLHPTIQSTTSTLGSSLWRPLQGAIDRWTFAGISAVCLRLRASQSGSGGDCGSRGEAGMFLLEQLSSVSVAKVATSVAATGSLAGRARFGRGYREEPARIRTDNEPGASGTARPNALTRELEDRSRRFSGLAGRQIVTTRAQRGAGQRALRNRCGLGRTTGSGGAHGVALARNRPGDASQGTSAQGQDCSAVARSNSDDSPMDCGSLTNGEWQLRFQLAHQFQ